MRELLGSDRLDVDLPGSRLADLVDALRERYPQCAPLLDVTKFARNGKLATLDESLEQGDEVALLPPVGGG